MISAHSIRIFSISAIEASDDSWESITRPPPVAVPRETLSEFKPVVPGETPCGFEALVPGETPYGSKVLVPGETPYRFEALVPGETPYGSKALVPGETPYGSKALVPGETPYEPEALVPGETPRSCQRVINRKQADRRRRSQPPRTQIRFSAALQRQSRHPARASSHNPRNPSHG